MCKTVICFIICLCAATTLQATNLIVSGISTPSAANGRYVPNGTLYGHNSWKHESQNYYIYYKVFSTIGYWDIDIDTDDADVLFYSENNPPEDSPINAVSWYALSGSGSPIVVEEGAPSVPEINVRGNSINIIDGDIDPSFNDFTKFGSASVSTSTVMRTYTIQNLGAGTLNISGVTINGTNSSDFSVTTSPDATVASLGTTTFVVTFDPTAEGNRNAAISIANNDADENPYNFNIQGYGFSPNDLVISGITNPSEANGDYIYQGVIFNFQYWKHSTHDYYLFNDEFSNARYWNIDVDTDDSDEDFLFYKASESGTPVGLTSWTANTVGSPSGNPVITEAIPVPDINVLGNSVTIPDDDVSPSFNDYTNFGSLDISSGTRTRTFTIQNTGAAILTLSGSSPYVTISGDAASDFSVTTPPSSTVDASASSSFVVTFNPSNVGTRLATISIPSNDGDENPYSFTVQGDGFTPKNLIVSNITTPADANGNYIHQGILYEFQYWRHESGSYYIYNDDYSGTRYWNIDINTDDEVSNFYSNTNNNDVSPVTVSSWHIETGNSGTPIIIEASPYIQATAVMLISNPEGTQLDISWTSGDGTKRAVFMKEGIGIITNPANNTTYSPATDWSLKGTQLGSSGYYCIYNSAGNNVSITNTAPNTQYTVYVFEYNNSIGNEHYNTASATGNPNDQTTLPIELNLFTASAEDDRITINWQTATEVNNYGFEVERSQTSNIQGENWLKVGFIQGNGNSNSPKEYSFVDNNLGYGNYSYRLKQVDNDGKYAYSKVIGVSLKELPKSYKLYQNYPNPFNPFTKIKYSIPTAGTSSMKSVQLKVYDILGNEIATLINEEKPAGNYEVKFDGISLSSGIYFYQLHSGNFFETRKMVLLK